MSATVRALHPVEAAAGPGLRPPRLPSGVGPSSEPKAPPVAPARRENAFAVANREKKTAYLVLEAVALAKRAGCSLVALADAMDRWTDLEWNQLAVDAGQHPPKTSRPEVLRLLRVRAAKEAPPAPVTRFFVMRETADAFATKYVVGRQDGYDTKEEAERVATERRAYGQTSGSGFAETVWVQPREVRS